MIINLFRKIFAWLISKPYVSPLQEAEQISSSDIQLLLSAFDSGAFKEVFFYLRKLDMLPNDLATIIPQFDLYITPEVISHFCDNLQVKYAKPTYAGDKPKSEEGQNLGEYVVPTTYFVSLEPSDLGPSNPPPASIVIPSFVKFFIVSNYWENVSETNRLKANQTRLISIEKNNPDTTVLFLQNLTQADFDLNFTSLIINADYFIIWLDYHLIFNNSKKYNSEKLKQLPRKKIIFGCSVASEEIRRFGIELQFLNYDVELQVHNSPSVFFDYNTKEFCK
jgi:hypothetical protein